MIPKNEIEVDVARRCFFVSRSKGTKRKERETEGIGSKGILKNITPQFSHPVAYNLHPYDECRALEGPRLVRIYTVQFNARQFFFIFII